MTDVRLLFIPPQRLPLTPSSDRKPHSLDGTASTAWLLTSSRAASVRTWIVVKHGWNALRIPQNISLLRVGWRDGRWKQKSLATHTGYSARPLSKAHGAAWKSCNVEISNEYALMASAQLGSPATRNCAYSRRSCSPCALNSRLGSGDWPDGVPRALRTSTSTHKYRSANTGDDTSTWSDDVSAVSMDILIAPSLLVMTVGSSVLVPARAQAGNELFAASAR